LTDARLKEIKKACEGLLERNLEHPKEGKLVEIISAQAKEGNSVIVFAQYRDTVTQLAKTLNSLHGVKAKILVGRADSGMSQKEQNAVVESFRDKEFNVLVATSIGEEGLDIPAVDLVVFYEAVPSEIRLIQRRGRAGRMRIGKSMVLVTKGTKDEAYLWLSRQKEKTMIEHLKKMQESNVPPSASEKKKKGQTTIGDFS
jgi:Fanconi anemia group M protein